MDTQSYIINDIKPIDITTSMKEVKEIFNELSYSHLPVVNKKEYVGCISEADAHFFDNKKTLGEFSYALEPFFVKVSTNWLDIIEAFA